MKGNNYMKPKLITTFKLAVIAFSAITIGTMLASSLVNADPSTTTPTTSGTSSASATTEQQKLQNVISRGDAEIERRLTTLNTLSGKINSATKLSASEKADMNAEVSSSIDGLTTLKTNLDGETSLSAAQTDVKNIVLEYRVYVLLVPKIGLMKVADDQQVTEANLSSLSQKLSQRLNSAGSNVQNLSQLKQDLSSMESETSAAQQISSSVESSVSGLNPSDYNANNSILSGYNTQLKNARTDNQAAFANAKTIVTALK